MIGSISGSDRYLQVHGGYPTTQYFNTGAGYMGVGDVRFNTGSQTIEVYDGQAWQQMSMGHAQVSLSPQAQSVIAWAEKKMLEEAELEQLAKEYPILEDAMRDLEVIKTLVRGKCNSTSEHS